MITFIERLPGSQPDRRGGETKAKVVQLTDGGAALSFEESMGVSYEIPER